MAFFIHEKTRRGGISPAERKMKMAMKKTSIALDTETTAQINAFVSRHHGTTELSTKIREIVDDYTHNLNRAKKEIEGVFTDAEWNYLRDMLNGTLLYPSSPIPALLVGEIEDADKLEGLGEKWEVDVNALVHKIKALSSFQSYALVKCVEEWWEQQGR